MPGLKNLSGEDVIRILSDFGVEIGSQRGSHAKLKRILPDGTRQTVTVANHKELDKGTLRAIFRQALRYIPKETLKPHFYGD